VLATFAEYYGAEVIDRPEELATDEATSADVILHALEWVGRYKYFVFLEPTSPLTEASDIDTAFEMLVKNKRKADAIVGVSKLSTHHPYFTVKMENGFVKPYMTQDFQSMRRQELEELYFFDGSLYISTVKAFLKHKSFYHDRTMGYVTPKWKSFEIDDITDFVVVEALAKEIAMRRETGEAYKLV
jgi:CMP-N-acetylneuraminic acid synthetase